MRRLFWLGIGLALGALIFRKLSLAAHRLTPNSLVQSALSAVTDLSAAIRDFSVDVREAMAEHEVSLREAAELDGGHLGAAHPAEQ